ncbi:hypothetical protein ACIO6T_42885 [Streptomyces sp. NPDC087532]
MPMGSPFINGTTHRLPEDSGQPCRLRVGTVVHGALDAVGV